MLSYFDNDNQKERERTNMSSALGTNVVTQTALSAASHQTNGVPSTRRSGAQADEAPGTPRVELYVGPHKTLRYMLQITMMSSGAILVIERMASPGTMVAASIIMEKRLNAPPADSTPCAENILATPGSASALFISAFKRTTMSRGRPAGLLG